MSFIRTIVLGLLMGLTLLSCKDDKVSNLVGLIPQDAIFVASFDLKEMSNKGEFDFSSSEMMKRMQKTLMNESQAVQDLSSKLLKDPSKSGLKRDQLYIFMEMAEQDDLYVAAAMQIENESDFEKLIDVFVTETKKDKPLSKGAYKLLALSGESVLVWNSANVMIYSFESWSGDRDQVITNNFEGKTSVASNSDFIEFSKKKSDIGVWINYKEIAENVKGADTFMASEFKDVYIHLAMNFEKGAIQLTGAMSPASKMEAFLKENDILKGFDNDLLKNFPDKSFSLMKIAIKPKPFMDYLMKNMAKQNSRESREFTEMYNKPETQTVINALEGDVMISMYDFAQGLFPIPLISGAVTLKSDADFDKIIALFPAGVASKHKDGYYLLNLGMGDFAQAYLGYKNKCMYFTDDKTSLDAFMAGNFKKNLTSSEVGKDSKKYDSWFYLNLDLDTYPPALVKLMTSNVPDISDNFRIYESVSYGVTQKNEVEMVLKFKDKSKNALSILWIEMDRLAKANSYDDDFDGESLNFDDDEE